jgi:hypothetical protein
MARFLGVCAGRGDQPDPAAHRKKLLIRCDGAGASHDLLDWLHEQDKVRGRRVDYGVGFVLTEHIRDAIGLVPKQVWTPAMESDGEVRDGADVAELTRLLDPAVLAGWPDGMGRFHRGTSRSTRPG